MGTHPIFESDFDCLTENDIMIDIRLDGDNGVLVWSDEVGVRIFNIDPLAEIGRLDTGSTLSACNIGRTNIVSLIGGGERPKFSQNSLVLYDAVRGEPAMDITFGEPLVKTLISRDTAIGVLPQSVYVYSIPDGRLLLEAQTRKNKNGRIDFRQNRLAVPGHKLGSVHIYDLTSLREKKISSPPIQIYAHQGEIAQIALNNNATRLATASEKGTLIRLWDTTTKQRLVEFRRGADPAQIYSISFSRDSAFLAVTGDKGTLHLFALKDKVLNKTSAFAKAGRVAMIPAQYTNSLWALATAPIPEEIETHVAFLAQNKMVAAAADGTIHLYQFSPDGAINRVEIRNINELDMNDDNW